MLKQVIKKVMLLSVYVKKPQEHQTQQIYAPLLAPFRGNVLEEKDFNGFIIPSKINAGWMYGTEQYDEKGEFFRVEIDEAKFK
jgi:hypothetical protein